MSISRTSTSTMQAGGGQKFLSANDQEGHTFIPGTGWVLKKICQELRNTDGWTDRLTSPRITNPMKSSGQTTNKIRSMH